MFETLFKRPTAVARHREGPCADARERFLGACAQQGYSRSMLMKIAWVLLAVAQRIDIDHGVTDRHNRATDDRHIEATRTGL